MIFVKTKISHTYTIEILEIRGYFTPKKTPQKHSEQIINVRASKLRKLHVQLPNPLGLQYMKSGPHEFKNSTEHVYKNETAKMDVLYS